MVIKRKSLIVGALLAATTALCASGSTMYLRRAAKLRAAKKASAKVVAKLSRSDEVTVIRKSGSWRQVTTADGAKGWVHKSRLTKKKPKKAGSAKTVASADYQATRVETSASIRGLSPEAKQYAVRKAVPEEAQKAVDKLIKYNIEPTALNQFMKDGHLGEYCQGE